jgi:hypothetical protein
VDHHAAAARLGVQLDLNVRDPEAIDKAIGPCPVHATRDIAVLGDQRVVRVALAVVSGSVPAAA